MRHAPLLLSLLAIGCSSPDDPTRDIARVVVSPAGVTLTSPDDTRVLTAQGFDEGGAPVDVEVVWTSSRPGEIAVDADGTVRGNGDIGSAQIVASVGGVTSRPVLATSIEVAPGVKVVDDADVLVPPHIVGAPEPGDVAAPYEVTLRGPFAVGELVLGRGEAPVAGEIIAVTPDGDGTRATLRMVELPRLVARARIDESLPALEPRIAEELLVDYDVTVVDGEHRFTPKPGSGQKPVRAAAGELKFKFGPLDCRADLPVTPFTVTGLPQFSLKDDSTFDVRFDSRDRLSRLVMRSTSTLAATWAHIINLGANAAIECKVVLYKRDFPFPGYLGVALAGELEGGIGFDLEGKLVAASLGVDMSAKIVSTSAIGMDCVSEECELVRDFDTTASVKAPIVAQLGQIRVEPSLFVHAFLGLKVGASFDPSLRTDVAKAKLGAKLEGTLAPVLVQTEPVEPDYRSSYKLALLGKVGLGGRIEDIVRYTKLLGHPKVAPLELSTSSPLSVSPKGAATVDKESISVGDTVRFTVSLDPSTIDFLGAYNVKTIKIIRHGGQVREVATIAAEQGQTKFELAWIADLASQPDTQFFAFVETVLPMPVDLELGETAFVPTPPGADVCLPPDDAGSCVDALPLTLAGTLDPRMSASGTVVNRDKMIRNGVEETMPGVFILRDINDREEAIAISSTPGFVVFRDGVEVERVAHAGLDPASGGAHRLYINNRGDISGILIKRISDAELPLKRAFVRLAGQAIVELAPQDGKRNSGPAVIDEAGRITYVSFDDPGPGTLDPTDPDSRVHVIENGITTRIDGLRGTVELLDVNGRGDVLVATTDSFRLLTHDTRQVIVGVGQLGITTDGVVYGTGSISGDLNLVRFAPPTYALEDVTALLPPVTSARIFHQTVASNGMVLAVGLDPEQLLFFRPASIANLTISVDGPVELAPNATATYAVNLRNLGPSTAEAVRAEFTLPDGFALVGTVGWQACETTLSTVTCVAPAMSTGEQRAFLVDLAAGPTVGTGRFTVRVSATTQDPSYANNTADLDVTIR